MLPLNLSPKGTSFDLLFWWVCLAFCCILNKEGQSQATTVLLIPSARDIFIVWQLSVNDWFSEGHVVLDASSSLVPRGSMRSRRWARNRTCEHRTCKTQGVLNEVPFTGVQVLR